ncbi:MAG: diguanylate cyclase [Pirellulales bacterium]|nr:diguanylate cyclase [Pirellulales bacterium]
MCSQPLKVLIVAEDRKLLRRLSKFLNTFGYETQQVADPHHVAFLLKTYAPDYLILDGGVDLTPAFALCRTASGSEDAPGPYTMLLIESPQVRDISAALQAGVDDFLAKPVDYGEILARMRAGARRREFERRFRDRCGVEPHTGLPNRGVFCARLQTAASAAGEGGVCVLMEVDFHAQINADKEWLVGRDILREVAAKLLEGCGKDDLAASFGGGRFGVFLPAASEAEAQAWSERIRYILHDIEFDFGDEKRRVTVSSGIISFAGGGDGEAEAVLEKAAAALQVAKRSGYNYVADARECAEDAKAWSDLAAPGVIFERTAARDVMTPCTLSLRPEDSLDCADRGFRRRQTSLLPVVNAKGLLQGVLAADSLLERDSTEAYRVRDLMIHDVKRFAEDEPFDKIKDFIADDSRQFAVVVRQGRPIGWIAPRNLLALGTFLNDDTFRAEKSDRCGSKALQVADL